MGKKLMVVSVWGLMIFTSCVFGNRASENDARLFFEDYVHRCDNYDASVAGFYAEDSVISVRQVSDDGNAAEVKFNGAKWRDRVVDTMPLAKKNGDINTFTNIEITLKGSRAKIKADRYSQSKCYMDYGYYMVIEKDRSGNYQIVEEYSETFPQSDC